MAAFEQLGTPHLICDDNLPGCKEWAAAGECSKNMAFMGSECRLSCGKCAKVQAAGEVRRALEVYDLNPRALTDAPEYT